MRANWTTAERSGVTLVEGILSCERPRQVRVESLLDGPVWPPRVHGLPESGWDTSGFEGDVDGTRRLGFATPAPARDPPVVVEWGDPIDEPSALRGRERERHPDVPALSGVGAVCRTLGDPRPPRVAVPVASPSSEPPGGQPGAGREQGVGTTRRLDGLPAIERRLERAEEVADARTLVAAAESVAATGGLASVERLGEQVAADGERLARLEREVRSLRERCERVDIPVETMEQLS